MSTPIYLTFSPTEAAGMGAMGAFLIALSRGGLTVVRHASRCSRTPP